MDKNLIFGILKAIVALCEAKSPQPSEPAPPQNEPKAEKPAIPPLPRANAVESLWERQAKISAKARRP